MYKNNVRKALSDWVSVVSAKKGHEWMIVHVADAASKKAGMFGSTSGAAKVFEKLKTDFGVRKERLVQVASKETDWNEFIVRLKECIVSSGAQQIIALDEDTKRLEAQRLMPGWNYCQYFILKESIGLVYEILCLNEEALMVYDQLESSFFQTLAEQGVPWFKRFGATDVGDDSDDVLNYLRKPYRDMIIQNEITIFDFRIYLFSRQCLLLYKSGLPLELCQRGVNFVASFSRTLRDYNVSLASRFGESWTYSACLHIVRHADELMSKVNFPPASLPLFQTAKGGLLYTARLQLDRLGGRAGFLKDVPLTNDSLSPLNDTLEEADNRISNIELKDALEAEGLFDNLYRSLTVRTIEALEGTNRPRVIVTLKIDLGYLHFIRGEYREAVHFWQDTCFQFTQNGWTLIDTVIIEKLATCYERLELYEELVKCLLHLLCHGNLLSPVRDRTLWSSKLSKAAERLNQVLEYRNHSLFKVTLKSTRNRVGDQDGVFAELDIHSLFPTTVLAEGIDLTLLGLESKEMSLLATNQSLVTGSNLIELSGKKPSVPGSYTPSLVIMRLAKLTFTYDLHQKHAIVIPHSPDSIKVSATLSDMDEAGLPCRLIDFEIQIRRNTILKPSLQLISISNIILNVPEVLNGLVSNGDKETRTLMKYVDPKITIPDLNEFDLLSFTLPFSLDSSDATKVEHKFKILLTGSNRDQTPCFYSFIARVQLVRPFHLTHDVIALSSQTLLRFNVTGHENRLVRLLVQELSCGPVLTPQMYPPKEMILFDHQQLSMLFDFSNADTSEPGVAFRLTMYYNLLEVEVECYYQHVLKTLLNQNGTSQYSNFCSSFVKKNLYTKIKLIEVATLGYLPLLELDSALLDSLLTCEEAATKEAITTVLQELISKTAKVGLEAVRSCTNSIVKPSVYRYKGLVHLPKALVRCKIVPHSSGSLRSSSTSKSGEIVPVTWEGFQGSLYDPFPCKLVIQADRWHFDAAELTELEMDFDIDLDKNDFELSGKRSGKFLIKAGVPVSIPIVLYPLKSGDVFLPNVSLTSRDSNESRRDKVVTECITRTTTIMIMPRPQSDKVFLEDVIKKLEEEEYVLV